MRIIGDMTDTEMAREIAALRQEVLELRAKVRRADALDEAVSRIMESLLCKDLDEKLWAAWIDYAGRDDD